MLPPDCDTAEDPVAIVHNLLGADSVLAMERLSGGGNNRLYRVEVPQGALALKCYGADDRLAREFDLPVIVHARRAVDAVIAAIRAVGGLRGVVHSFSGSAEQAAQLHKLGFLLGIGGPVTYERANRLRGIVASMPLEQLLLETDSPDQPGAAHRGERNEPAHLVEVLDAVAQLRGVSRETLAAATDANAERLFNLALR